MRYVAVAYIALLSGCAVYDSVRPEQRLHFSYAATHGVGNEVTWARFSESKRLPLTVSDSGFEVTLPEIRVSGIAVLVFPVYESKTDERLIFDFPDERFEAPVTELLREQKKRGIIELGLESPNKQHQ